MLELQYRPINNLTMLRATMGPWFGFQRKHRSGGGGGEPSDELRADAEHIRAGLYPGVRHP
jgi:hypothetical protein